MKFCSLAARVVVILIACCFAACAHAGSLTVIGQATYNGKSYNLVYDSGAPFRPIVWLDYNQGELPGFFNTQTDWAASLNNPGTLTYALYPAYSNINWNGSWRLPVTEDGTSQIEHDGQISEFNEIYFNELGNPSTGTCTSPVNIGPFVNFNFESWYWLQPPSTNFPGEAWVFAQGCQFVDWIASGAHVGIAVRPAQLPSNSPPHCVHLGDSAFCPLVPVCDPSCALGSRITFRIPIFAGVDPFLDSASLSAQPATEDEARNLSANLKVNLMSFGSRQPAAQRAVTAEIGGLGSSGAVRAFVIAPTLDLTGVAAPAPAVKLAIPYQSSGIPVQAVLRLVRLDSSTGRWREVGSQTLDAANHIVMAHVAAEGRYSVVAVLPTLP
jgi:hypothetical protein